MIVVGLTLGNALSFPQSVRANTLLHLKMHCALVGAAFKTEEASQEENPLKLKSLAVITLIVLGCSPAFGQTFSLGFRGHSGTQYCDYEVVKVSPPYAAGTHNLTTDCGSSVDGVMVGFKGYIPLSSGAPVTGTVMEMSDNFIDASYQAYTGCQVDWVTKTKASTLHYGWAVYYSCSGGSDFLLNYGYLTTKLGATKQQAGAKVTSFGAALAKAGTGTKK